MSNHEDKKRRAELQEKYKQMEKASGVYQVRNKVNGKIFIGSCIDINSMFNRFRFQLEAGGGIDRIPGLLSDWKQYGEENFSFEILEKLEMKEGEYQDVKYELGKLEEKWLEKVQPYDDKGYNKRPKK